MPYLSQRALDGFSHYQYKSAGYTILDVWHTPVWEWIVNRLPLWLAPNLITLTGLSVVFASWLLDTWYTVDYKGGAPSWVSLFRAIAVAVYVNLDCMDGKQARRTRSSSPLGQLFDHGCDALSVGLLMDGVHTSFDYPCDWFGQFIIMMVMMPWILAHWEEYHTGNLLYGDGIIGVLESNYILSLIHLTTFFGGVEIYPMPINSYLPVELPFTIEFRHVYFTVILLGCFSQVRSQLIRVFSFDSNGLSQEERGDKELGTSARVKHLAYILVMLLVGWWWTSDSQVVSGQCRAACMAYNLIYALIASNLIVAHMAKQPMPAPAWAYGVLMLGAANKEFRLVDGRVATAVLLVVALAGYSHYIVSVVEQICHTLGLKVFTIKVHAKET